MPRYVVLHHTGHGDPHFDFMFEMEPTDEGLTTFRCPAWPVAAGMDVEELPEHRRAYLDYEGPVSNGRGEVRRVESGVVICDVTVTDPPTLAVRLSPDEGGSCTSIMLVHSFRPGDARATLWTVGSVVHGS